MVLKLRPHQKKAVDDLGNGKILWGGVGSGKTLTSLVYFFEKECQGVLGDYGSMRTPKDIFVITTAKKRDSLDWEKDAAKLGISTDRAYSVDCVQLKVDSWNNIGKYEHVEDAFFVFDEQRLVGSGSWTKSFIKIAKKNRWILLSATPGDTWLDYIPVFVANDFYKNRTEFKREHVVYNTYAKFPKVDRYVGTAKLFKLRNQILVEMPYAKHTVRHLKTVFVDHDVELLERVVKKRWHVYEDRPLRDVAELFSVMRKVVNSDSSRIAMLSNLMKDHPKLIVFYNFDYELEMLRELSSKPFELCGFEFRGKLCKEHLPCARHEGLSPGNIYEEVSNDFAVAEWNGHKHEPIPTSDRWVYLVQYTAGAEGWNCIDTDAVCFFSLTYSYKQFEQGQGRIDRLNTPFTDLYYYVFRSKSFVDSAVWKALEAKKSFNLSELSVSL